MSPRLHHAVEKRAHLSPERLSEVEDFIDFLPLQDRRPPQDFARASESAFAKARDNDDDAVYDTR